MVPQMASVSSGGSYVDVEAIVEDDAVVFKRLLYRDIKVDLRKCSVTMFVRSNGKSGLVTVNIAEPVSATWTAALEKPEELRLNSGQGIVLPYTLSIDRSDSGFRERFGETNFLELKDKSDKRDDPAKTTRLFIATVSVVKTP